MSVDAILHVFRSLEKTFASAIPSTDTARKSYMTSQGQEDATHAGLGSVEAGISPVQRYWTVKFQRAGRSYYDRVEAPDVMAATAVTLSRNEGATCSEVVCEITRAEYDRFTRRSP